MQIDPTSSCATGIDAFHVFYSRQVSAHFHPLEAQALTGQRAEEDSGAEASHSAAPAT